MAPTGDSAAEVARRRAPYIAAFSNLSTAYNLVNINLAHVVMENQYCGGDNCSSAVAAASTACLAGAIIGQLTFGYVGDCLGRGRALQLTMFMSIAGALISSVAVPLHPDQPETVFAFLSIARLILGIGVGGVYPLAATVAAENSSNSNRGRQVALVFSMQGIATLLVPLVGMVFLYGFGDYEDRHAAGKPFAGISWRLILGIGALPGLLLIPFQCQAVRAASQAPQPASAGSSITLVQALSTRAYWRNIVGCAGGWFLFDITFYGNTLFAPTVLKSVFHMEKGASPIGPSLEDNLCWQLTILALLGLPGYYVSVCFMDKLGRKNIQLQGFFVMALLYAGLGAFLTPLQNSAGLLLFIYGLTYFFSNFGPNSTTFILPSESFPKEVRSSLNGFCAAAGKVGATVGSATFKPLVASLGTETVFSLCAACAGIGILVTAFCVDDRRGQGMEGEQYPLAEQRQCAIETGTRS
eukprot:TRINITY_DN25743_c3_g1_i1.p1 TRINITY_DN25743_c3_g1~~TRINITY_DN25743_c3_g1_i1.p1  ORF type:complete len:485 (-),score=84.80 TRINITY_DN25743_c3_g1_i1:139-1545(-)